MVFPLEDVVRYNGNIYELTVAASRRAFQLAKIRDEEIEDNDGKVVSLGVRQIFENRVIYKIEQQ